ncbi:recombinase family protein [Kitasatospora sp. NPDC088779]|uniref:recombinase family protein n=1 Tax=Kitasatospora sp. NPDC088779 TaxID=3154964 RepID=UPI003419AC81
MPSDTPRSPGRVPVALYIATANGDAGGALADPCRQYADAREWVVAETFTDTGPLADLNDRSGWLDLSDALSRGTVKGIVTWTRSMVAGSVEEWDRLTAILADRGWFLVAGALDTPGQPLYSGGPRSSPAAPRGRAHVSGDGMRGRGSGEGASGR